MSRFQVVETPIAGLKLLERRRIADGRGFLTRMFCSDELKPAGWSKPIAQINHTMTRQQGTVRGLHFQLPPYAEMKLVNCIRGDVWDVAVDLRRDSATFLKWFGTRLSGENGHALLIPEGFAHGFQALVEDCELLYFHTNAYRATGERGVHPEDPRLAISWPKPVTELSARDQGHPMLSPTFQGISI